jgi:hypothetical protein
MSRLATVAACLACAAIARAQNINIDIGTNNPVPSAALGAAAGQPGTWNAVAASSNPVSLVDLSGAPSGATIQRTSGLGGEFSFDNATTNGDDGLLLDDGEFPSTTQNSVWTITGLAGGTYEVTTYAWAPDSPTYFSGVSVNGGPVTSVGGTWTGVYQLGVTHAFDTVTIPAGGAIVITISTVTTFATFDGIQIHQGGTGGSFTLFCSGDGSGTACPCGNSGAAGNGCASSVSATGAHLAGSGSPSIGSDTFTLTGTLMPNSSALYFQGTTQQSGGLGTVFGDGLRCAGGSVIRLGTKTNVSGTSSYPTGADVHIGLKGMNSAGAVRTYQCWYRNAASFCTPSTFNLTNGLQTTWIP